MANLKDVAKAAGVSVGTVSRVLNNSPNVSPEKRDLVMQVIKHLNFQPNFMAQNLSRKRLQTGELGLVVTGIDNPANVDVVRGATEEAIKHGYFIMICTAWTTQEIRKYLNVFIRRQVEGVAIASYMDSRTITAIGGLQDMGVPLAICRDAEWPFAKEDAERMRIATVDFESTSTCEKAVQYLIGLGHKRIAAVTGNAELSERDPRLIGYINALQKAGMEYDSKLLYRGGSDTIMTGVHSMQQILATNRDVTAVFAFNDLLAFGVIKALQDAGLNVPQDVSVIGFDNIIMSGYSNPGLTTINVPKYEIGCALVRELIGMIRETTTPGHEFLSTNLVVRQSTGFAKT